MSSSSEERASARADDVCPFDRIASQIDELEVESGERVGGATWQEEIDLRLLWMRIGALRPSTLFGWRWLAQKQARGVWNDWDDEEMQRLALLSGHPLAVGC